MKQHIDEGNKKAEEKPYLNILDIAGGGKVSWYSQKNGCKNQHGSQIDRHYGFKEELLQEVCAVNYHNNESTW